MDNFAREVMLAKQAGMSYGQWKALQPVVNFEKKVPEGYKKCPWCGKYFKPHQSNQRYCEIGCRTEAYQEKIRKEKKNESST